MIQRAEDRGQRTESLLRLCRVLEKACPEVAHDNLSSVLCLLSSVKTDSRDIKRGDTFVAYPGEKADGRQHIAQAIAQGANAVLWEARDFIWNPAWQIPNLAVADLRHHAGDIAAHVYGQPSKKLWMVGITGTNGKTSCSHWASQMFSALGKKSALIGTLGNGFPGNLQPTLNTTPDAIRLQGLLADYVVQGAQAVAMEVSSHALEQGRVNGVKFDVALLTNLSRDHLDYHGNMQHYAAAKRRLFDWQQLKYAVLNLDDAFGAELAEQMQDKEVEVVGYGLCPLSNFPPMPSPQSSDGTTSHSTRLSKDDSQVAGYPASGRGGKREKQSSILAGERANEKSVKPSSDTALALAERFGLRMVYGGALRMDAQGFTVQVHSSWGSGELHSTLLGRFNAANLLGVLATLLVSDVPLDDALRHLSQVSAVPGRMQTIGGSGRPSVVVDYAHTPDALEKVLQTLREVTAADSGKLICVFGCGGDRDRGKRPMMGMVAAKLADVCIVTSDNPRSENPGDIIAAIVSGMGSTEHQMVEDRAQAITQAIRTARAADTVLVAGKGHETYQEISGVKYPFSDVEVAQHALQSWPVGAHI